MLADKKELLLGRQEFVVFASQAICILCYGLFTEFGEYADPLTTPEDEEASALLLHDRYPLFQDVHIMIFVGFGFLMVFLKNHSWTSVGFNYLIAAWAIQIAILFTGFWHNICSFYNEPRHHWTKIPLNVDYLILADFAAGAVLISFGAVLGKIGIF